ncbi:MAG: AcrR family transcriptional regulator [Oleispira sp.]|jgi:AcrR family transcriptional regulator
MRRIAADVGMGVMTLYKYFANKNAILHPIWDEFIVELFVGLQENVFLPLTQLVFAGKSDEQLLKIM